MKKINKQESIKVVTSNTFITAKGLENISLKGRKLLYIAIAQCRRTDKGFYDFGINLHEFAKLMDVEPTNIYQVIDDITTELLRTLISVKEDKTLKKYTLFSKCEYQGGLIYFKLNQDMTDFLLKLKKDFTQPLLHDFLKMNSPYSIAVWHLMQKEMQSKKPYADHVIEFNLTLEELRQVTGTEKKLKQISEFKSRVLDKAIHEIEVNCGVVITYDNAKEGRIITGFHFTARSPFYAQKDKIAPEIKKRIEEFQQKQLSK